MRIQETDKVLKEARIQRHATTQSEDHGGALSRVWKKITSVFRHG